MLFTSCGYCCGLLWVSGFGRSVGLVVCGFLWVACFRGVVYAGNSLGRGCFLVFCRVVDAVCGFVSWLFYGC